MLSFHGKQEIKDKYIDRVLAHQKADRIIQKTGWDGEKGCAVGCTLENYDSAQYPIELGVPIWLANLEDAIFEGLSKEEALEWPAKFLQAISVGIKEEKFEQLRHKLAIKRQERNLKLQEESRKLNPEEYKLAVINAIKLVINYHKLVLCLIESEKERSAAASAEELAESAESARSAAQAAARSAWRAEYKDLLELLSTLTNK